MSILWGPHIRFFGLGVRHIRVSYLYFEILLLKSTVFFGPISSIHQIGPKVAEFQNWVVIDYEGSLIEYAGVLEMAQKVIEGGIVT